MFYVFDNDILMLPIIENKFYLGFQLFSKSKSKKIDNLSNIVGGCGISMIHELKRHNSEPRNSILLRCHESKLNDCLQNCYIIAYWVNTTNQNKDSSNKQLKEWDTKRM